MSIQKKILITGSLGQIGPLLAKKLRGQYGDQNVVLTDMRDDIQTELISQGPFYKLDVTDGNRLAEIVKKEQVTTIYHLAALLSGRCEEVMDLAWTINIGGIQNVLKVAKQYNCQVFNPSTIGVFGKFYDQDQAIQDSVLHPQSIYGITKVYSELLCDYYHDKFGVDTRGVRYPGIISANILGGGTTDYAVYMLQHAVKKQDYQCFLLPDTRLDMMYIDDAVNATVQLMDADSEKLVHRNAFNITAMNFTPNEIHKCIKKHYPEFQVQYDEIDETRQKIADSWPNCMSAVSAMEEWNFSYKYDLKAMTKTLIDQIKEQETQKN